jgi:hypothetical protein
MKSSKQWKGWYEFFKSNPDLLAGKKLEHEPLRQLKHLPIKVIDYYGPNWSGWNDFLSRVDK